MANKKILIVDDDADVCEQVVACLEELGYQAFSALNGEDGLRQIESFSPHLVLL
ncbi:MAG: DNA-binding response regulator, partial [Candidatus Omnitrophica bacterium]|nr:DNA-binding response regulator [Candidatus Omnitrophota bacterium]